MNTRTTYHLPPATYHVMMSIIITLLFVACTNQADEATIDGATAPLSSLTITRAAADLGWGTLGDGSVIYLHVKDDTGQEKKATYLYDAATDKWATSDEIRCATGSYPAYATGAIDVTYPNGATETLNVCWIGPLNTTLTTGAVNTVTADNIAMQIANARIKVDIIGAYGEDPADPTALPNFYITSTALVGIDWGIPADPYTQLYTSISDPDQPLNTTWMYKANNGYSKGCIAPQALAQGSTFLTLEDLTGSGSAYTGKTYTVDVPTGGITLEAGKEYHYTIRLDGGGKAQIVNTSINDFNNGGNTDMKTYRGIATEADLRAFAADWEKNYTDAISKWEDAPGSSVIRLLNNITMTGGDFTPIGGSPNFTKATFDGGGHTITGLIIPKGSDNRGEYAGLFSYITSTATVRGLHLRQAVIKGTGNVGGIAGGNSGTIMACSFEGTIEATLHNTGGIAGENYGIISGCYSLATKVTAGSNPGAIAGSNYVTISGCHWVTSLTGDVPAYAAINYSDGDINTSFGVTPASLFQTDARYVTAMNNALARLSTASPYSWVQVSGNAPVLIKIPPVVKIQTINTEAQLRQFANDWNNITPAATVIAKWEDTPGSGIIRLGNDITMSNTPFEPIGDLSAGALAFNAIFDGDGHTITGLKVDAAGNAGLFGTIENGTLRQLNLRGATIKGSSYAGGIVGELNTGSVIACSFGGTVEGISMAGGIVGANNTIPGSTITGCYSIATKVMGWVGGGIAGPFDNGFITACHWLTGGAGQPTELENASINVTTTYCHPFTGEDNFYSNAAGNLVALMNNAIEAGSAKGKLRWRKPATGGYPELYIP